MINCFYATDKTKKASYSTDLIKILTYECLKRGSLTRKGMIPVLQDVILNTIQGNSRIAALIRLPDDEVDFCELACKIQSNIDNLNKKTATSSTNEPK